jgi:hypothetical protein
MDAYSVVEVVGLYAKIDNIAVETRGQAFRRPPPAGRMGRSLALNILTSANTTAVLPRIFVGEGPVTRYLLMVDIYPAP